VQQDAFELWANTLAAGYDRLARGSAAVPASGRSQETKTKDKERNDEMGKFVRLTMLYSILAGLLPAVAAAQDDALAVNTVMIDGSLSTAGQPDADTLGSLAERGYRLVVNLAPPQSRDAVHDESRLLGEDGVAYVNIPVDWQRPTLADFALFSAVLDGADGRKTLVHCQMNMRASVFTFLYRVVHGGVAPDEAYEAVRSVWRPNGQWAEFGAQVLEQHGIDFQFPPAE